MGKTSRIHLDKVNNKGNNSLLVLRPHNVAILMKRLLLFLFVVANTCPVFAQDKLTVSQEKAILPSLLFKRFYTYNGLPDERIRSLFQDSKGFLWIGTMNGISRYDGYTFKNYFRSQDKNSIMGNWAYDITEDAAHDIWIATNEGLSKFEQQKETFINYSLPGKIPAQQSGRINTLHFDKQGILWVGGRNGLFQFNIQEGTFKKIDIHQLNGNITKIIAASGNEIWIAMDDAVVNYNTNTGKYKVFEIKVKPGPYGDKVWALLENNKDLYIATAAEGLMVLPYDKAAKSYTTIKKFNTFSAGDESLDDTQVFDIRTSLNNDIWLGTSKGVAKIAKNVQGKQGISFYRNNIVNSRSISSDRVYKVFIDKTNVLWCGTEVGLNKLDLNSLPFHYYTFANQKFVDQIKGIYTVNGSNVWLCTFNKGFVNYDIATNTSQSYTVEPAQSFYNSTRSLFIDNKNIWLGTLNGVLKVPSKGTSSFQNVLPGHVVFAIIQDRKQNIWIGTNNGLFKQKPDGSIISITLNQNTNNVVSSLFVRSVFEDSNGNIWVGFENSGVAMVDIATNKLNIVSGNKKGEAILGNTIYSITEYPKNTIWMGSESGLTKVALPTNGSNFADANIKTYSEENGLPDKSISGLLSDDAGNLWISTIKGLVKFDIQKGIFQNYLPSLYFSYSCCYKLSNHQFYFGTSDGFITFDPTKVFTDVEKPTVSISDIKLFNKPVKIDEQFNGQVILKQAIGDTKKIELNYRNNVFTIDFAALHFANPEKNSFAYKMQGFDKDWIQAAANNRSATYTNLDAGTYTFKLKAANYLGVWNNVPAELQITILPPPWKTWWAYLIYTIIAVVVFYIVSRYTLIQIKQRQQLVYEKIEKEQLRKLDEMKTQFFTDISHEFRTPLSLIVGPAEEMLSSQDLPADAKHKTQLIHRNSKKLLYLIDELMTFQKLDEGKLQLKPQPLEMVAFVKEVYQNFLHLAEKKEINFTLTTDRELYPMNIDPGKMEMVLNNLLFNAFKYVPQKGTININILQAGINALPSVPKLKFANWLSISIEDNGKGISDNDFSHLFERYFQSDNALKGTGVGLSLTKNLVELHNGLITAKSEPGVKTSFSFYLPLEITPLVVQSNINKLVEKQITLDYNVDDLIDDNILEGVSHFKTQKAKDSLLLVDDNIEVLDYLEMVFQNKYNVDRAINGLEALEYLKNHEPDLILSDVMMPEMDGIQLCKELKTNINTSHIPLILLTAKATVENTLAGLQIGADDYISKPFNPDILKAKVTNFIEGQKRIIEKFVNADNGVIIPKDIAKNPLDEEFLQNVMDAVTKNLDNEEFSVEELGSMVAMSRSNLFRKLKAVTGQTPIEFIYHFRLRKAMEMLLERKLSVSQISYEVGFKSPSSFTKSFKKQYGKSPTSFLNNAIDEQKEKYSDA
ncbi:two-component regulator propeller domain-containing protein [Parasediminibacterium sp. JCM 36343]|uniref:hybrid sensor histidine kinase/response regulator transcription factor n=1 Tax=Parasediminibacterium sp. JCM 36343 TaxID=3374279 RepID=UPI00397E2770